MRELVPRVSGKNMQKTKREAGRACLKRQGRFCSSNPDELFLIRYFNRRKTAARVGTSKTVPSLQIVLALFQTFFLLA
jgi:hypothetical protein